MTHSFQTSMSRLRSVLPRGWSPILRMAARFVPSLQHYQAKLTNGDHIFLDLRETMCLGLFFDGRLPHESGTEKLIKQVLRRGDVFVDVGANLGYFTRIASHVVGEEGLVLAFEPNPKAVRLLKLTCADLFNVRIFPNALSNYVGTADFYVREAGDRSSLYPDSGARPLSVSVTTLDKIVNQYDRVDFIKIDVEGFELEVLFGAMKSIKNHEPIICFEFLQQ